MKKNIRNYSNDIYRENKFLNTENLLSEGNLRSSTSLFECIMWSKSSSSENMFNNRNLVTTHMKTIIINPQNKCLRPSLSQNCFCQCGIFRRTGNMSFVPKDPKDINPYRSSPPSNKPLLPLLNMVMEDLRGKRAN